MVPLVVQSTSLAACGPWPTWSHFRVGIVSTNQSRAAIRRLPKIISIFFQSPLQIMSSTLGKRKDREEERGESQAHGSVEFSRFL
jgi:hypothetical protein